MTQFEDVLETILEEYARKDSEGEFDTWEETDAFVKEKAEVLLAYVKEESVSKEPKFKQGDILYNVSDGNKIEIIDIVADQYKFECGDKYPHYDFFGYIESNYSKYPISENLDDYAKEILSWEDLHEDWDRLVIRKTAKHFTDWHKEQMTKTAIDGKIYETQARSKLKAATIGKISGLKYRVGDKVKLIILKED